MFVSTAPILEQSKSVRFDSDYQAIINKAVELGYTLPSYKQQIKQNALILALKHSNIWNSLDVFYVLANDGSSDFAKINWKNPSLYGLGYVNVNWSGNTGLNGTGVGTVSYVTTGYNPTTHPNSNFTQNSASIGAWLHTASEATDTNQGIMSMGNQSILMDSGSAAALVGRLNGSAASNPLFTSATYANNSMYSIRRASSSQVIPVVNGSDETARSSTSLAVQNAALILLNLGTTTTNTPPNTWVMSMGFVGSGSLSHGHLYRAFSQYMTDIATSTSFTAEYQAILDRATTLGYKHPTEQEKIWQNQLLYDLKSVNIWNSLDVFYNFWVHDSDFATLNWKAPSTLQCTKINSPLFIKHHGFSGNGSNSYLNTGWVPSGGISFTQNAGGIGFHTPLPTTVIAGSKSSIQRVYLKNTDTTNSAWIINANTLQTGANTNGIGTFHVKRTSSSATAAYRNATSLGASGVDNTTSRPTVSLYLLAENDNGTANEFTSGTMSMFWAGAAFSGLENTIHRAWESYRLLTAKLDSDYKNVLDRARQLGYALPSYEQLIKQSNLIKALKQALIWDSLDVFYVFATDGDSNFATLNWKSPNNNQITTVNSPSFTPNSGFTGNGTSNYLNTNWNPSTATNYLQNNASIFAWVNNNIARANNFLYGVETNTSLDRTLLNPRNAVDNYAFSINNASGVSLLGDTVTNSIGFYHVDRTGSNNTTLFKNGSPIGSHSDASSARLNLNMYVLASNQNGVATFFSTSQISCIGFGSSLSGKESTLHNAWNNYFSSL